MANGVDVQDLAIARRLMVRMEALRHKHLARGKPLSAAGKKAVAEDDAQFSEASQALRSRSKSAGTETDSEISLADLRRKLQSGQTEAQPATAGQYAEIYYEERTRTETSVTLRTLKPVTGLVVNDKQQAETDRYQFDFESGTRFKITDKWTGKSSTVWSDPYVDLSDMEGDVNGDFKDLKASTTQTTFQLQDGTRVTFTAQDTGVIEQVDIFRGQQHVRGVGAGSAEWGEADAQFFATGVQADGQSAAQKLSKGDVVVAGGDGNDWFNEAGGLVWGKTTGPSVTSRPAFVLEASMTQVTEQVARIRMVDRQA